MLCSNKLRQTYSNGVSKLRYASPVKQLSKINLLCKQKSSRIKCKILPKCTKFSSARRLEVAAKSFGLLTKNRLMYWQIRGLKAAYRAIFVLYAESLNSNFACGNSCTHIILLPIGPQQSMLMLIKWIWVLNLFLPLWKHQRLILVFVL